jgi:hypothetical protein
MAKHTPVPTTTMSTRDGRSDDARHLERRAVEADRVRELGQGDHLGHERLPGQVVDGLGDAGERHDHEDRGEAAAPLSVSTASAVAVIPIAVCVQTRTVRLSKRSAMSPAQPEQQRGGNWARWRSRPRDHCCATGGAPAIEAMVCIQVPISDTICPPKNNR